MKNYGRFFNERNEKHKLTAVILLTAGIITFVAVLHTVRVIIRESGGALERDAQIVASLFSLCGIILLTALILFFVWNDLEEIIGDKDGQSSQTDFDW